MRVGGSTRGREPLEDQISSGIGDVVQISEPDLVAGGITVDLLKVAGRVGMKHEAAEHKDLSGKKSLPGHNIIVDEEARHQSFC